MIKRLDDLVRKPWIIAKALMIGFCVTLAAYAIAWFAKEGGR